MNIRTKLILSVGILAGMIILLVALSVVNLQILTATEPDSPAAMPGLQRALLWISVTGGICILASIVLLVWLPRSINKPIRELTQGILEIANHNYEKRLDMSEHEEFREVADSFNSMAERLTEYRTSTLNDILSAKKFLEAIVNSIHEPIIGLNRGHEILFINKEALTVLNLKREDVIRRSAEELSLKNDLLRRLVRELINPGEKKEPLKIYADNKEIGAFDQIEYLVATALKGVVFLLAWQYFKYKRSKKLFIFAFSLLLFFQILAGYKGAIVMTFIIIFIANYLALKKINFKLGIICFISLIIAYGLVNPYREYLVYSKEIPNSISSIFDCIYNGVLIQNQIITSEEVSIIDEVMSRFTTLPELATFIEYKEKFGLHIPRDPDFLYYFYTIPAQLFVPRFLWPDKPVNDLGVWWVSNTVTGNMSNSSTAFGPVGFLYLTFDILAVIIGFLIISFLLKLCEQLLNSGKDGAVLTGVIFLSSLYTNEAGFNTYVVEGIRFLIIGIIFQAIILRRIWK